MHFNQMNKGSSIIMYDLAALRILQSTNNSIMDKKRTQLIYKQHDKLCVKSKLLLNLPEIIILKWRDNATPFWEVLDR